MSLRSFSTALITILLVFGVVGSVFLLIVPKKVEAQVGAVSCLGSMLGLGGAGTAVGAVAGTVAGVPVTSTAILAQTTISAGATTGNCVNSTIIMPLARLMARTVLQQITASTINFINGKGFSWPSFVRDLSTHLQMVGDSAAMAFISQFRQAAFNSPFGPAIAFALQDNYQRQSSLRGFLTSYTSTLFRYSPNQARFLAGDWSQGGAAAWFALTTQSNNNPYEVYLAAQGVNLSKVNQVQANRKQDLIQSSGFLSWCPDNTSYSTATCQDNTTGAAGGSCCNKDMCGPGLTCNMNSFTCTKSAGASVQAPCTNPDGTPAKSNTPGSVIHDYTQKALVNTGMDQLVNANDIDSAIGAIATALINNVIGGTGLFAQSQSSGSSARPFTDQMLATTTSSVSSSASVQELAQTTLANITAYTNAWNTITATANTASTSALYLIAFCTAQQAAAKDIGSTYPALTNFNTTSADAIASAQNILTNLIAPVFSQAQSATDLVAATNVLITKAQADASAAAEAPSTATDTNNSVNTLSEDIKSLTGAHPTIADVATIQASAASSGGALANPKGSLTISGGSLVDQLNLVSTNATALKTSACTIPPPPRLGGD